MIKKINSEYKIENIDKAFFITMGTADKKMPEVVYTTLSTYITPLSSEITESDFINIEKKIEKFVKNLIISNNICSNNTIIVCDCAYNRVEINKPSYFTIQIYFKPTNDSLIKYKKNFKSISTEIYDTYVKKIVKYVESLLKENNLILSKIKNNYQYNIEQ